MWLDQGLVRDIGEPPEVIQKYESWALQVAREADLRLGRKPATQDAGDIRFTAVECYDTSGNPKSEFEFGESFEVRLHYESSVDIHLPYFAIFVRKGPRQTPPVSVIHMLSDGIRLEGIPRQGVVRCVIESPPLSPGVYRLYAAIQARATGQLGEQWYVPPTEAGSFTVLPGSLRDQLRGIPASFLVSNLPPLIVTHSWSLNDQVLSNATPHRAPTEGGDSRRRS